MRLRERIKGWFEWLFTKPNPVPYTVLIDATKEDILTPEQVRKHVVPVLEWMYRDEVPPTKETTMGKFEVFKDAEGGFTVRLRAKNGRKRNVSESYTRHHDAIRAARGIRDDSRGAVIVDLVNGGVTVE